MRRALLALAATTTLLALGAGPAQAHHPATGCWSMNLLGETVCPAPLQKALGNDGAAETGFGETSSDDLRLVHHVPKTDVFTATDVHSDMAFQDDHLVVGNYKGISVFDISGDEPKLLKEAVCPGSQNDVSVWEDVIVTSTDSTRNTDACEGNSAGSTQGTLLGQSWEGLRIWDWSDRANPKVVKTVKTKCGSHTHTLVPDEANRRIYAYVSSYSPGANLNCLPPHDLISIVEIPLDRPQDAKVVAEPVLFPLLEGGGQPSTSGCHDITAYPAIGLAAGACMGEGILMDITNPAAPKKLSTIVDSNFAFWHSATFSNDGTKVIFTDELGGGTAARCTDAYGPNKGADAIYDITDRANPKFISYFKIPRYQTTTENCVSHNGNLLPHPTRDLLVQAWYQGGTSIVDFTDAANPKEVAFFDRGPINESSIVTGGHWSSYWYNGRIYGSEIYRGLDVFEFSDDVSDVRMSRLNAQTQEPLAMR
jgi:hypothetical protein